MSISKNTYISNFLSAFNLINICSEVPDRYPVIFPEELPSIDLVILPSEPYHFKEHHIDEMRKYE